MQHEEFFEHAFLALTSYKPLRWQRRLYRRLRLGDLPGVCDLPTGLGKTSIIPIWLIALASQQIEGDIKRLPRRLIYIVNRRTVVDQATDVAEDLRKRVAGPGHGASSEQGSLARIRAALHAMCAFRTPEPLGISTLRGQLADNEAWKVDPARPAIIIGTIDMIGSKLLFSGYGDGPYRRAHHAGLVGQDSWIIHDEAHLTPAFGDLLRGVAREQERCREARATHVTDLSATARVGHESILTLEPEDYEDDVVKQRLRAEKRLRIHVTEGTHAIEAIARLAASHEAVPSKILIYVRSPESAHQVVKGIEKRLGRTAEKRVALLAGTIRGHERDELVKNHPVYRAFLEHSPSETSQYLVSTSAGEVGVDFDADHLVCDLSSLDSMIQRLGRVNRKGGMAKSSDVDIVASFESSSSNNADPRLESTLRILRTLPSYDDGRLDGSPLALRSLVSSLTEEEKRTAWSSVPQVLPISEINLDSWALTSIDDSLPGRPEVASYLHGLTNDPPETYVAWRWEIGLFAGAAVDAATVREWFRACRIESREKLKDRTSRIKETLEALLAGHRKIDGAMDFPLVILDERGTADWSDLSSIVAKDFDLRYRTVILPVEAGGLDHYGMLDPTIMQAAFDVADEPGVRERRRLIGTETVTLGTGLVKKASVDLRRHDEGDEEAPGDALVLHVTKKQSAINQPETASARQSISEHSRQIEEYADLIAKALGLAEPIANALTEAARRHDVGKAHPIWQRYACNDDPRNLLAKSSKYLDGRDLAGYRHELGSLMEAVRDTSLDGSPERDLILHLIASHHASARPHFSPRAFDNRFTTSDNENETHEVMRRFSRLGDRFGRWGLAWIEALMRSADIAASQAAERSTEGEDLKS